MAADPFNPNSVVLLDVGQGGENLRWDHKLSKRSPIKGGQKLQTYIYIDGGIFFKYKWGNFSMVEHVFIGKVKLGC